MRDDALIAFATMAAMVLLPLVPAFLLFKFLPSAGSVDGPLHGLKVKFGGAFAAYLVVFLCLFQLKPEGSGHYHTWTVSGRLEFERQAGELEPNVNDVFVRFVPPRLGVLNQGAFTWEIPVIEDRAGRLSFPDVQIDLRDYGGITIPLRHDRPYGAKDIEATYDDAERRIVLTRPLVLRSVKLGQAYAPTGAMKEIGK